ncbi:MAG: YggS family pyridoxal phosphate-dependent enzyme [Treponema sp.]|jgi:pyridoxal phosphate enzyme (YggS family)|nr:YggS family pyridoxal phosphate-dependent enzyme [Treponema sp.]
MTIAERYEALTERIAAACRRAGRESAEVRLLGASKFQGAGAVIEAWGAGLRIAGENRVQEAAEKMPLLAASCPGLELHMIGSLQRNKARQAAALFDCIESVDRDSLIEALAREAASRPKPLSLLFEYHTAEDSKAGYPDLDSLCRAAETALAFPALRIAGLMTMAPLSSDAYAIRRSFRAVIHARERLRARFPDGERVSWQCLSMGMSGDFELAIEEGSTLVRIGTALFGERIR